MTDPLNPRQKKLNVIARQIAHFSATETRPEEEAAQRFLAAAISKLNVAGELLSKRDAELSADTSL